MKNSTGNPIADHMVRQKVGAAHRLRKARYIDNIFIKRLWRSLKYECVYLHAWETGSQARAGVGRWITF